MATQDSLNGIKQATEQIVKFNPLSLLNRPEWGALNFEDCAIHLRRTLKIAQELQSLSVELLPDHLVPQIIQSANSFSQSLQRMSAFNIRAGQNPAQEHAQISQNLKSAADQLFAQVAPLISYLAVQRGDVESSTQKILSATKDAEGLVVQCKERIAAAEKDIGAILTKARETSASSGAAVFTREFETAANQSNTEAGHWLFAAGGLAIITVLVAWAMWEWT